MSHHRPFAVEMRPFRGEVEERSCWNGEWPERAVGLSSKGSCFAFSAALSAAIKRI
jgi:hypothetical protein